jgi:hypothetical protein
VKRIRDWSEKFLGGIIMTKKIDLNEVMLTPAVYDAWLGMVRQLGPALLALGVDPATIPDEHGEVGDNGNLTIVAEIPKLGRVSMEVPREHWQWRSSPN